MTSETDKFFCEISYQDQQNTVSFEGFSYKALESAIRKSFSLSESAKLTIKYQDEEGDLITVTSDLEMEPGFSSQRQDRLPRFLLSVTQETPTVVLPAKPTTPPSIPQVKVPNTKAHKKQMKKFRKLNKKQHHLMAKKQRITFKRDYNAVFHPSKVKLCSSPDVTHQVQLIIHNIGRLTWPIGSSLVRIGKCKHLGSVNPRIALPGVVTPGDTISINFTLFGVAHGRHVASWHLQLPNGVRFGPRFTIKIKALGVKKDSKKVKCARLPVKRKFDDEQNVAQLVEMGFDRPEIYRMV